MSQAAIGSIGGITGKTQGLYEGDKRRPDADYLNAVSHYIDVNYVVCGKQSEQLGSLPPATFLRNARVKSGLSQEAAAASLGVTRKDQVKYESGSRIPDTDYLAKAEELLKSPGLAASYSSSYDTPNNAQDQFALIPRYDVTASAGNGSQVLDEEVHQTLAFRKSWLSVRGLQVNQLSIIEVTGDSMIPRLHPGDLVLINHLEKSPQNGRAYVIRVADELIVKYVQLLPGEQIQFSSENTNYPPYTVAIGDVTIIGRVVSSSHEW